MNITQTARAGKKGASAMATIICIIACCFESPIKLNTKTDVNWFVRNEWTNVVRVALGNR